MPKGARLSVMSGPARTVLFVNPRAEMTSLLPRASASLRWSSLEMSDA